jgi:hypothetical protein
VQAVESPSRRPTSGYGGDSDIGVGVEGSSRDSVGLGGFSQNSSAVIGFSQNHTGVQGISSTTANDHGVVGLGQNTGVAAFNHHNTNAAYLASDCCAAYFVGDVTVVGTLRKSGGGFLIDSPGDPAGSCLSHSFVESSERKNVYDGVVVVDVDGVAVIELPSWLEALNTDFRYQLTSLGGPAPNLHVAEELHDNHLTIAGGAAGGRVSWQMTGVRQDPWAKAHPIVVEDAKPDGERGHYFHPELYGEPEQNGITQVRHPGGRPRYEQGSAMG